MSESIKWSIDIQATGGPKLGLSGYQKPEAYGKINVNVEAGVKDLKIALQPDVKNQMELLVITSDTYSDKISYKVNKKSGDEVRKVMLDGPHVLIGKGAVSLLDLAPASLFVTNDSDKTVTIEVLVGRDATPPP